MKGSGDTRRARQQVAVQHRAVVALGARRPVALEPAAPVPLLGERLEGQPGAALGRPPPGGCRRGSRRAWRGRPSRAGSPGRACQFPSSPCPGASRAGRLRRATWRATRRRACRRAGAHARRREWQMRAAAWRGLLSWMLGTEPSASLSARAEGVRSGWSNPQHACRSGGPSPELAPQTTSSNTGQRGEKRLHYGDSAASTFSRDELPCRRSRV